MLGVMEADERNLATQPLEPYTKLFTFSQSDRSGPLRNEYTFPGSKDWNLSYETSQELCNLASNFYTGQGDIA